MEWITVLGFMAGSITSLSFLPQVIKAFKTRHVEDLAFFMPVLLTFGMGLWLAYGIIKNDIPIIVANTFGVICSSYLVFAKIRYNKSKLFK